MPVAHLFLAKETVLLSKPEWRFKTMRTQFMSDPNSGAPWIEYYQVGGSSPIKLELNTFPFVIGRDESVDFTVESGRVSRKHVAFDQEGGEYILRDLESTNGTYVNGKRVSETRLSNGDVVIVADFELTFFGGQPSGRNSATQVMTQPVSSRGADGKDLILQVRRLQEALTHRCINARFQPLVKLDGGDIFGYEAICELGDLPGQSHQSESFVESTECRLTERIHQQHRLFAVEQAAQLDQCTHLFLRLQVSEISAEFLPDSLLRLADISAPNHQLVAQIPDTAVCDIPYFRQFLQSLRARGIKVEYNNFCGSPAQITDWHAVTPDFLKLSPSLVRGIHRASGGWRTVQLLIQATQEIGCASIAMGVDDAADAECLVDLGCDYGQGAYFGTPQPINAFSHAEVLAASS